MTQLLTPAETAAKRQGSARDAFDRITFLGWNRGLAAIVAGLAASFFLFGYAVVYWRNADMDFMVIYNALAMNDGKPQAFFDHTAYLTILAVKSWFKLLHRFGMLDAYTLAAIPPASDAAGFDLAMTGAVRAGRVLAFLVATGCVLIFAGLMRLIVRDWRVAMIATFAFAFSGAIAVHLRILRSELIAACPVIFALMVLIVIGRRANPWRPLGLALAAALCVLGLENKVQAILLIGILPILVVPFGTADSASDAFWTKARWRWPAVVCAGTAALAAAWAVRPLLNVGFNRALLDAAQFHPILLGHYGVYQALLAVLIGACMIAYAAVWRITLAETLASLLALVAGAAIALLLLEVDYNANNVIAVFNPLEKTLVFADASTATAASGSNPLAIILLLIQGIGSVLARYAFVLHFSPRPTVFLTWLIIPGIAYAWRHGERQAALQALMLMLAAIVIDALGVRRGLKSEYFIFTDPLMILAGALLLDRLRCLRFHKWAYPIAVALFGLNIAVGQSEPVKNALKRSGPQSICEWNGYYMPLLPLPWCAAARSP